MVSSSSRSRFPSALIYVPGRSDAGPLRGSGFPVCLRVEAATRTTGGPIAYAPASTRQDALFSSVLERGEWMVDEQDGT